MIALALLGWVLSCALVGVWVHAATRRSVRFEDVRECGHVAMRHTGMTVEAATASERWALRKQREAEADLAFLCADAIAQKPGGPKEAA